ncbi:MAG TPA: transketolase [Candidatus Saccharimonadales bacterium]|jgi:transketolase|nr:transketolase [Candidatus Saccharimonadales bacterium]
MTKLSSIELQETSKRVRMDVIKMIYEAGSGHPGGSLSCVEIMVALYSGIMEDRDHFFLSNGHVCPALYSVMAEKGIIEKKLLSTYAQLGSPLQGHPERTRLKGIENTSGPLGLGLAQASGYAAIKKDSYIYCMTSDGEHDEGNHWEAVMFAAKYNLNNLIQIIDRNRIQIEGTVEEIMPLGNLIGRYKSFNWNVFEIDGHNFNEIIDAAGKAKKEAKNPSVIVANTVFGRGVSFMEGNPDWHARAPNEEEYKKAMEELSNE